MLTALLLLLGPRLILTGSPAPTPMPLLVCPSSISALLVAAAPTTSVARAAASFSSFSSADSAAHSNPAAPVALAPPFRLLGHLPPATLALAASLAMSYGEAEWAEWGLRQRQFKHVHGHTATLPVVWASATTMAAAAKRREVAARRGGEGAAGPGGEGEGEGEGGEGEEDWEGGEGGAGEADEVRPTGSPLVYHRRLRAWRRVLAPLWGTLNAALLPRSRPPTLGGGSSGSSGNTSTSVPGSTSTFLCVVKMMLARLGKGRAIPPHIDRGALLERTHRVHVPLVTNTRVAFRFGARSQHLPAGGVFVLNNGGIPHGVDNWSASDRIHLIVDCTLYSTDASALTTSSSHDDGRGRGGDRSGEDRGDDDDGFWGSRQAAWGSEAPVNNGDDHG